MLLPAAALAQLLLWANSPLHPVRVKKAARYVHAHPARYVAEDGVRVPLSLPEVAAALAVDRAAGFRGLRFDGSSRHVARR